MKPPIMAGGTQRHAGGKPRRLKAAFNPGISAFARFRGYGLIPTLFPEGIH